MLMKGFDYIPMLVNCLLTTDPEKIILFGSYASGDVSPDSDIDILVVTRDESIPNSFAEKNKTYISVAKTISGIKKEFPVDLLVHTKAMHTKFLQLNSQFAQEIQNNGKVLYEKSNN